MNWLTTTLADPKVAELNPRDSGKLRTLPDDLPVTFVPMAAVDEFTATIPKPSTRPLGEVRKGFTPFRKGDVLLAKITPCMENGKVAFAGNIETEFGFGSTEFHVVRASPKVNPKLLYYRLRLPEFRAAAKSAMVGAAGQQRVPAHFLESLPLRIPNDSREQARIVELLDQADALRRQRAEADTKLARLLPALFHHHFGESNRLSTVKLGELGELDRGRSRHRPRNDPSLYDGPYPFIQTGDVTVSGGRITTYSQTYSEAGLAQSRLWPRGTLCITIAANIAETAVLDFDACFPDSIVGFMPKSGVTTEFVQAFIDSMREQLVASAPQAAQKNINLEVLRNMEVPLPTPTEQDQFAKQVTQIRSIQTHAAASAAKLETLFQTLLHRAFTGELTAKWRAAHLREGVQEMPRLSRA
jgi:type I restriction enzyme S subunit